MQRWSLRPRSRRMERVLAIDPGERVGWAIGLLDADSFEVERQGVHPLQDFAIKLGKSIQDYDTVVYEQWRLYPDMGKRMVGNDMQPSQLVGIIRYLGWITPGVKLVTYGATIKKTALKTMPDEVKARFDCSSEQHDKDALMHLWHYYWEHYVTKEAK